MKIGMTLPVMEPGLTRQDLKAWTKQIDQGPWSHIALGERILFSNPEFISTLSAVAAWTNRVEIIATISVLTMHDPVLSAKQFATIDMLSEGRFTLGVGVGGREEDYEAIGANWSQRRWRLLAEKVKTMQSIWSKDIHSELGPALFSAKGPEILAGAVGPKAMEMAADYSDGLAGFSFNADIEEIKDSFTRVVNAFTDSKKTPRLVTSFWFGLGQNSRQDIQIHLNRYLGWMGEDLASELSKTAGLAGSERDLKEFLLEIKEAGATDVLLVPTSKDIGQLIAAEEIIASI
ncbi:LLM class flavin-dependent oxidoreductase [Gammaproteobacteria bacterium]|jgi:alkanesulfonate monooxygenase SsuD/methylene tetrahydromethanopterin reductase-like flavin-dependent oxidoreductase (luciferase family)|nr:LLM class flavin-dependent oxidoreductase [Gammaproteobacteria bacterium]